MNRRLERMLLAAQRQAMRNEAKHLTRMAEPAGYIVAGLRLSSNFDRAVHSIDAVSRASARIGLQVEVITVSDRETQRELGERWIVKFPGGIRDNERARLIADHLRIIHSAIDVAYENIELIAVREKHITKQKRIDIKLIIDDNLWPNTKDRYGRLELDNRITEYIAISEHQQIMIWNAMVAICEPKVERAVSFLYESHQRAWFATSERWQMSRRGQVESDVPRLPSEIARLESAVVSAFKVVEALLGNIKQHDIGRALLRQGYTSSVTLPFPPNRTIALELIQLAEARDARAAHGSRTKIKTVSGYEVMAWQTCAKYLVEQALKYQSPTRADFLSVLKARATQKSQL